MGPNRKRKRFAGEKNTAAGEKNTARNNRRIVNVDRNAELEYLMRRFGDDVLSLAYFYLKDRQMAEDAAQEVFLRVYNRLDEFRGESSYYTWIYRITVNLCRDRLRSWYCRRMIPWERCSDSLSGDDTEEKALDNIEASEVLQAVLELPPIYREVVVLKYYSDLPVSEIARICGIKNNNVRVRLHRAYQMLKEKLGRREISSSERPRTRRKA